MISHALHKRLVGLIEHLNEKQAEALAEMLQTIVPPDDENHYDEDNDPTIGLYKGSPDLSSRVKEILAEGADPIKGWTQRRSGDEEL